MFLITYCRLPIIVMPEQCVESVHGRRCLAVQKLIHRVALLLDAMMRRAKLGQCLMNGFQGHAPILAVIRFSCTVPVKAVPPLEQCQESP